MTPQVVCQHHKVAREGILHLAMMEPSVCSINSGTVQARPSLLEPPNKLVVVTHGWGIGHLPH